MRIRWSPEAADDFEEIVRYIQKDNHTAARKVALTIYERIDALKKFPNIGRVGRVQGSREMVLAPLPYIVVYRLKGGVVQIGRILHGAQDYQ